MSYGIDTREERVAIALEQCAAAVKRTGSGRWEFQLVNGKSTSATALLIEDWLLLESSVSDRIGLEELWRLLRLNAGLEGLSKFVLMPKTATVRLRADIPLVDEYDSEIDCDGGLDRRLQNACAGLKTAFRTFGGRRLSEPSIGETPAIVDLPRLCGDAGWSFVERSAGKLAVDLESRGGFYSAMIEQRGEGVQVSVEIGRGDGTTEMTRRAIGALLLKTGALVRLARPSVEEDENGFIARFDVKFPVMPGAVELKHALSSLSVACTLCGREVRAINDEFIARRYLAIGVVAAEESDCREEAMLAAGD